MSFPPSSLLPAVLLFCGISMSCASPSPATDPIEVEYRGCQAVLSPGPTCVLSAKRKLRLWVEARPEQIEIRAGDQQLDAAGEPVQNGQQFLVTIPPGATRLDVLVKTVHGEARWSLAIAKEAEPPRQHGQEKFRDVLSEVNEEMREVHDLIIGKRQLAAARKVLASLQLPRQAPAESRCLVCYYSGLLAEREGNYRSAMDELQRAVDIAERVNLEHKQRQAEEMRALVLRGLGRARESAQLFERLRRTPHDEGLCEESPRSLNNEAWSVLLAGEAGESFEDPTDLLEQARQEFETCKRIQPEEKASVEINLALAHLQAGRLAQAKEHLALATELEPHPSLPDALWRLDLEARIALLERQPAKALHQFQRLEELAAATYSSDGRMRAAFGRARCFEALGNRVAALEVLRRAETLAEEQSRQISLSEGRETFLATRQILVSLHLELLLEEGRTAEALNLARQSRSRMLRQLERRDRLASLEPDRRAQWDRIVTDYRAARAALEERAKNDPELPTDELHREQLSRIAAAEHLKKALDQAYQLLGDPGGPPEEQAPPASGELILAYLPLPQRAEAGAEHDRWVGFAAEGKTVTVQRFSLPPDVRSLPEEEQSRRLLGPFRASIEKAKTIRILASGPLQSVDFHKLPFAVDVLLTRCPVVYGLDLSAPRAQETRPGGRALLIADPRGDLQGAMDEARAVHGVLASGTRWVTKELKQEQATEAAVLRQIAAADLLHYAGHGSFSLSGFGGWDSSLLLAQETKLTLGDLLALERVPAWVVLSSCDSGQSSTETPVESLGLAHAFLLAGSRAVVASTRSAFDRKVPAFFAELYRQWDREPDLAVALRQAQLNWRRWNPGADWAGFRLFVP